jgi:hypothetical protein
MLSRIPCSLQTVDQTKHKYPSESETWLVDQYSEHENEVLISAEERGCFSCH